MSNERECKKLLTPASFERIAQWPGGGLAEVTAVFRFVTLSPSPTASPHAGNEPIVDLRCYVHTLKNERPTPPPVKSAIPFEEAEPNNAHVAFAIVLLGTVAFFVGGFAWFLFR